MTSVKTEDASSIRISKKTRDRFMDLRMGKQNADDLLNALIDLKIKSGR